MAGCSLGGNLYAVLALEAAGPASRAAIHRRRPALAEADLVVLLLPRAFAQFGAGNTDLHPRPGSSTTWRCSAHPSGVPHPPTSSPEASYEFFSERQQPGLEHVEQRLETHPHRCGRCAVSDPLQWNLGTRRSPVGGRALTVLQQHQFSEAGQIFDAQPHGARGRPRTTATASWVPPAATCSELPTSTAVEFRQHVMGDVLLP